MDKHRLQANAKNLGKKFDDFLSISEILRTDILDLLDKYEDDWESPTMQRLFVRTYWAMIEGIIFNIKQFTLTACELGEIELTEKELATLKEQTFIANSIGEILLKNQYVTAIKNIKDTLCITSKKFQILGFPIFDNRWKYLQSAIKTRNSFTHPKISASLFIKQSELEEHKEAFSWFIEQINLFSEGLQSKYGKAQSKK